MAYAQFATIDAADFNALVGGNPTTTVNTLNATWATGGGTAGYGQTAVANVTAGTNILASTQWASLVSNTASAAGHQGSSITSVSTPVAGGVITYNAAIPTNLTTIYNNRLNASTLGSTTSNSVTYGSTWSNQLTFTHTITFANGNAARYFFNAGGQIKMTATHPGTSGIDLLFNNLATNIGTVVMSAPASGTVSIAGVTFNGITKVGGGGAAPTISPNNGYYALTTSNATVFTQTATTGPSSYSGSFIRFIVQSNGTQGSNGDAGSVVTIYTIWDEVPDGLVVATGSNVTCTLSAPSTANIANTWGSITLAGSATGS
jgi:hypothetical protein